jgi:asparagine synthase (glutamine-hydrolysing)
MSRPSTTYRLHRILSRVRDIAEWRLSPTAQAVRRERLTYLSSLKLQRLEGALSALLSQGTTGDILEFGIALGGSAIVLAQHAEREGRAFHGFDVFGMIPPPNSEKDDARSKQRYEVIAAGESPGIRGDIYYGYRQDLFDQVRASFARHGVPVNGETIVLHKGTFEETWPSYRGNQIAFAHIDCDWYEPVKFCLERVASRMSPGGVIVLDDYHDYGGCRTATDEFLYARGDFTFKDGANPVLTRSPCPA